MRVASSAPAAVTVALCLCLSASHAGCIVRCLRTLSLVSYFASAHPMRVASVFRRSDGRPRPLCLSASHAGCIGTAPACILARTGFASAHPLRVASQPSRFASLRISLCLSASPAGCIATEPLCILADFTLPQRIPCGLHLKWPFNRYVDLDFASAHPMRVASAKMHKIYSMDL